MSARNLLTACVMALAVLATEAAVMVLDDHEYAGCDTDSDCMAHCPPPADDDECDGGPQS